MTVRIFFWRSYYLLTNPFRRLYWRIVQPQTRGVKCLIKNGQQFLLVRLAYGHKKWTLPGGGVDKKESFEQGAWRELKEETGVVPKSLKFFGEYKTRVENKHDTVQCFFGESDSTSTVHDPLEILGAGWFTRNTFPVERRPGVDSILKLYDNWRTTNENA